MNNCSTKENTYDVSDLSVCMEIAGAESIQELEMEAPKAKDNR